MVSLSPLQKERVDYCPKTPPLLELLPTLVAFPDEKTFVAQESESIKNLFPHTSKNPFLSFKLVPLTQALPPLRIGVVLSGGQAPGGHNVIAGLFDGLKDIHPDCVLVGFLDGPEGIIKNKFIEITKELLFSYRNQGGFDIIGSGRSKIETSEQFEAAEKTVLSLGLNGLVIIGGDDSNTNAAFLAEYFKKKEIPLNVVGVPKTIDGDLKNEFIEISFGFDTACKVYSEMIGNILKDSLSSKKYYFFIKLMGRSASHITLECALKTHPNLALIGEEIAEKQLTLKDVVQLIVTMIVKRAEKGKNYGVILIPEGIIEFIPDVSRMLKELNSILANGDFKPELMSPESLETFNTFPKDIQKQLLFDRDSHGNVQVSKIESERFLMELVGIELEKLEKEIKYKGKFSPQPLFLGYEGRSALPSNFDADYCYTLGNAAAVLLNNHASGYMACVKNLSKPYNEWEIFGVPIHTMLHQEVRGGKEKTVIKKALVDLASKPFIQFQEKRELWMYEDDYLSPGPIQFFGPPKFADSAPLTLLTI
jgi:diphosphate-dependent phosphofructokinase